MKTGWTAREVDEMTRTEFFRFLAGGEPEDEGGPVATSFEEAERMGII